MKQKGLNPLIIEADFQSSIDFSKFYFFEKKKLKVNSSTQPRLLDEYALAHRMSYFLWSSVPDGELWDLATQGKLRANLREEVKRMIRDPKIDQFVKNFCGQWLQLRDLNLVNPNPAQFPAFSEEVRDLMILENRKNSSSTCSWKIYLSSFC